MTEHKKQAMQFFYGERELSIKVTDLLSAPADVIVNAANSGLSHAGGVAGEILSRAGDIIQSESDQFIREHGELESGMVAFTSAGQLPYQAIIHAVGPKMGEGDEQRKIEYAVSRSLQLCSMHDWQSVAFPAISTGIFGVPVEIVAQGFFRAITSFWDARMDGSPEKILLCLTEKNFDAFFHAFRNESIITDVEVSTSNNDAGDNIPEAGIVELTDSQVAELDDQEFDDWFK